MVSHHNVIEDYKVHYTTFNIYKKNPSPCFKGDEKHFANNCPHRTQNQQLIETDMYDIANIYRRLLKLNLNRPMHGTEICIKFFISIDQIFS